MGILLIQDTRQFISCETNKAWPGHSTANIKDSNLRFGWFHLSQSLFLSQSLSQFQSQSQYLCQSLSKTQFVCFSVRCLPSSLAKFQSLCLPLFQSLSKSLSVSDSSFEDIPLVTKHKAQPSSSLYLCPDL